jgi:uncharacterized protein (TIGR00369 family)
MGAPDTTDTHDPDTPDPDTGPHGPAVVHAHRFAPLPAPALARWERFLAWDDVYFPMLVGLQVEELRQDYARLRLPYRPELRQPAEVVHGGALATLVDTVVVPAVGSAYEDRRALFTVTMTLDYLGPVAHQDAIAEGWVVRRGRSMVFCQAEVRCADGRLAATASLVYKVSSRAITEPAG